MFTALGLRVWPWGVFARWLTQRIGSKRHQGSALHGHRIALLSPHLRRDIGVD
jgi:hypothetical protein